MPAKIEYNLQRGGATMDMGHYEGVFYPFRFKYDGPKTLGVKSVSFSGPHRNGVIPAIHEAGGYVPPDEHLYEVQMEYFITLKIEESVHNRGDDTHGMEVYMPARAFRLMAGSKWGDEITVELGNIFIPNNTWMEILFQLDGPPTYTMSLKDSYKPFIHAVGDNGQTIKFDTLPSSKNLTRVTFVEFPLRPRNENIQIAPREMPWYWKCFAYVCDFLFE